MFRVLPFNIMEVLRLFHMVVGILIFLHCGGFLINGNLETIPQGCWDINFFKLWGVSHHLLCFIESGITGSRVLILNGKLWFFIENGITGAVS